MDRQGSILSTLSDFDILDGVPDQHVEFGKVSATGDGVVVPLGVGHEYLHPNREIFVKISVRETHGFAADVLPGSSRLYDIECSHHGYKWRIVRKYSHFEELHRSLRLYRASLFIGVTPNTKTTTVSLPPKEKRADAQPMRRKVGRVQRKVSLRFPNKPEIFISSPTQVERRRRRLEEYLNAVLKDPTYRTHESTMRFLEISKLSFAKNRGEKFHEGYILKRSGGRKFSTLLSCFQPTAAVWNKRWLVLKDSYVCYLRHNQEIADVMLFDQDFYEVKRGLASTRIKHGLIITNTVRELALKTTSHHKRDNWVLAITQVAESCEYTAPTPHASFAPQRKELAHWYVDAASYFADVASALENAQEEIFITDWWMSPELFLRRPVVHMNDPSRLDKILLKKAEEGVKIYILLYKEIEMAVGGIQSFKCKTHLESSHPNIMVMRHPDHLKSLVYMWTHHEKLVCVDQTIAFLGGLDLCYGRWDDSQHRLTDLGWVQSATPPTTRPVSTASTSADDWKGIGSSDLKVKGAKKKALPLPADLPPILQMAVLPPNVRRPSPRSWSTSDVIELKGQGRMPAHKTNSVDVPENQVAVSAKLSREFRRGVQGAVFSHSTTVLDKNVAGIDDGGHVVDSLNKSKLHVSDEDVFMSVKKEDPDWLYNNVHTRPIPHISSDVVIDSPVHASNSAFSFEVQKSLGESLLYDTRMNSIPSPNGVVPFTSPPDELDGGSSAGFEDCSSVDRLDVEADDTAQLTAAGSTDLSPPIPLIALEPIRGFCVDLVEVTKKKSRGKVPNPPPKYSLVSQLSQDDRDSSPKRSQSHKRHPKGSKKLLQKVSDDDRKSDSELNHSSEKVVSVGKRNGSPERRKQRREDRKECRESRRESREARKEMREKRREARLARESVNVPEEDQSDRGKSWRKLRNSMDKIKRVLKHENSQFDINVSRRSSSASTVHDSDKATKLWLGKDYVNWIHKDLDSADAPYQDMVDRFSTVRMPWHDIACVVFNKAATDVGRHFIQRWNHAKKVKASSKTSSKYPLLLPRSTNTPYKRLPPFIRDMCELVNCQVLRSCSGWSSGMQRPETSIYNAYIELIEHSEYYIYIENQFFISWCGTDIQNCICEALVNRITKAHQMKQQFRVYIVLPLLPAFEADLDPQKSGGSALFSVLYWIQQSLIGHENSLFKKLRSHGVDPSDYVSVTGLRTHGSLQGKPVTELIYVHSKLMIVDDRKCIIGSANINDRSLSGVRDSEIAVVIEDEFFHNSTMSGRDVEVGKFCYSLRNNLFQEHLGLSDTDYIQDITCEQFYKHRWVTTAAVNTSIYSKVFNCLPCDTVTSFQELRAYKALTSMATSDPVVARQQLMKVRGSLVMYPLEFLKNEKLINHLGAKEKMMPNAFWT